MQKLLTRAENSDDRCSLCIYRQQSCHSFDVFCVKIKGGSGPLDRDRSKLSDVLCVKLVGFSVLKQFRVVRRYLC